MTRLPPLPARFDTRAPYAIAERIRTRLDDRVPRRYLSMLRTGQRAG